MWNKFSGKKCRLHLVKCNEQIAIENGNMDALKTTWKISLSAPSQASAKGRRNLWLLLNELNNCPYNCMCVCVLHGRSYVSFLHEQSQLLCNMKSHSFNCSYSLFQCFGCVSMSSPMHIAHSFPWIYCNNLFSETVESRGRAMRDAYTYKKEHIFGAHTLCNGMYRVFCASFVM